jgi:hypothetical protein
MSTGWLVLIALIAAINLRLITAVILVSLDG